MRGALTLIAARFPQSKTQLMEEAHVVDAGPVGSGGAPLATKAGGWKTAGGAGGGEGGDGGAGGLGGIIRSRGHSVAGTAEGHALARSALKLYRSLAPVPPQELRAPFTPTESSSVQGLLQFVTGPKDFA